METLLGVDDEIAALFRALETRGRLENAYAFLLSDNGSLMGHHRLYSEMVPYDGSIRIPLYVFGPEFAPGAIDDRLVANIDLAPTTAEVAGASASPMDGRSLLSGLARDAVLIELLGRDLQSMDWPRDRAGVHRDSALHTTGPHYVEYQGGAREPYYHRHDPHDVENLLAGAVAPEGAATAAQLSARLALLRGCRAGTYA